MFALVSDLVKVGQPCRLEYVEDGKVIIRAEWKELDKAYGWVLVDGNDKPLAATKDVLLDRKWRMV